jgi:UDP-N-acetylmuramoyl-tripeptide--D-alanyl-D-alanine ligase
LGLESAGRSVWGWLVNLIKANLNIIYDHDYPEILVLELGADKPGDIEYLTKFIKPDVAVITAIGEIPVHVEFFAGPKEVAREKSKLVAALKPGGTAVLNHDDDIVLDMRPLSRFKNITFGFEREAQVRAYADNIYGIRDVAPRAGINFKLEAQGSAVPVNLGNVFSKASVYAALAAAAVGMVFEINLIEIANVLKDFKGERGRMKLIEGIKHSWIIDDTYNAAPLSMTLALDTLTALKPNLEQGRKIAVLGDMRELGKYSFEAHEAIGTKVVNIAAILIVVGDSGKIIGNEAQAKGLKEVYWFQTSEEAGKKLQQSISEGDLVLIKGSRALQMEKTVLEIMAHPELANELLVH